MAKLNEDKAVSAERDDVSALIVAQSDPVYQKLQSEYRELEQRGPVLPEYVEPTVRINGPIKWEKAAELFLANPITLGLYAGSGIHEFLSQFLKLYPPVRNQVMPYFTLPMVLLGAYGFKQGMSSVTNPSDLSVNDKKRRILYAFLNGYCAIFIYVMGEEIQVYCSNPDNKANCDDMKDLQFLTEFFPAPFILASGYFVWEAIGDVTKAIWVSKNRMTRYTINTVEMLANALCYSRTIQAFLMNTTRISEALAYEAGGFIGAGIGTGLQYFQYNHRRKIQAVMTSFSIVNLLHLLINYMIKEANHAEEPNGQPVAPWIAAKSLFITFTLMFGFYMLYSNREKISHELRRETVAPDPGWFRPRTADEIRKEMAARLEHLQERLASPDPADGIFDVSLDGHPSGNNNAYSTTLTHQYSRNGSANSRAAFIEELDADGEPVAEGGADLGSVKLKTDNRG